ncbi:hypothetical protein LIER_16010 [Lithospermum erythrorhizon]|uniref:Uncharacterized protein n=1 Tax=Lithospermum erythrorhizon TaxID=34254 RepID=A0AAV3Q500_LITER
MEGRAQTLETAALMDDRHVPVEEQAKLIEVASKNDKNVSKEKGAQSTDMPLMGDRHVSMEERAQPTDIPLMEDRHVSKKERAQPTEASSMDDRHASMGERARPTDLPLNVASTDGLRDADISFNQWTEPNHHPKGGKEKETFVVRMPRDQVYRVPPPEHAKIVENYKNIPKEKKGCKVSLCCWVLIALAILGIAIGIIVAIIAL